jgi:CheY-like chemotaxis protein
VRDGALALSFLVQLDDEAAAPDLMLLDLNLPMIDGHEVLAAVRKHPRWAAMPVIVVTSSDAPKTEHALPRWE